METTSDLVLKAMEFAKLKHKGQKRDDGSDFFEAHPLKVYQHVKMRVDDENVQCAALLHDVLEDTPTSYEELLSEFNKPIAEMVLKVTCTEDNVFPLLWFPDGEYDELTHMAQIIKHFDTSVNISEMYTWTPKQRVAYLDKKMCWLTHTPYL